MCVKILPTPIKVSGYENLINFNTWARFLYYEYVGISKLPKGIQLRRRMYYLL